jgi:hypothetical protein
MFVLYFCLHFIFGDTLTTLVLKKQTIKNNAFYIFINLNNFFCRTEGSSKVALAARPLTPVEINKQKKSPVKVKNPPAAQISPPSHTNSPSVTPVNLPQDESSKGRLLPLILIVCFFNTSINNQAYIDCLFLQYSINNQAYIDCLFLQYKY